MPEFEKTVKKALIDKDLTMGMLAERLGISIAYVSDLIKGKRRNQKQIDRICDELNIVQESVEKAGDLYYQAYREAADETEKGAAI